MTIVPWAGSRQLPEQDLSQRLDALAQLVKIGRNHEDRGTATGFGKPLLDESEALLRRAGERLRLSGNHTVVALAGGTGSGKSTLFNALAGATFSQPGVTRPTTRHVHACVWGMQGAAPLLDWLGVQYYARIGVTGSLEVMQAVQAEIGLRVQSTVRDHPGDDLKMKAVVRQVELE